MAMDRRTFLRAVGRSAAATAAATVAWPGLATAAADPIENVILIRFGGGTRYTEWLGDPEHRWVPELWNKLRPQGTLFTNMTNEGRTGHFPGAMYLLTGRFDWYELAGRQRPETPTLFEHLRKANAWTDGDVVLANHHRETNLLAYSGAPDFGDAYGALQLRPADVRRRKVAQLLETDEMPAKQRRRLEKAAQRMAKAAANQPQELGGLDPGQPHHDAFLRALDPQEFRKAGGSDAQVAQLAMTAMNTLQPRFLTVVFQQIDVAHRGYWSLYTRAIANTDRLTARIVEASQTLPFYRGRTAVLIVPDCGRSLDGMGNYGFQNHHAPDFGCRQIGMLALGPGIRRGAVVEQAITQADVAPTIGAMLHTPVPGTEGRVLDELWA